jgi:restriction endonuclease S subunit
MEVKPGYKQTEVGVIPEDWEVEPISRIVERLEAGVSVNSVDENITSYAHSESVLKTSAVTEGCFLPHECKKIAPRDLSRVSLRPRANTIIISRMNTPALVGECGYVEKDHDNLFLPDRLWMTKQRSGNEASIRWLAYLLSSKPQKDRIKELATGTSGSMKNLAKSSLLELQISFPLPPEQRAIALCTLINEADSGDVP